MAIPQQDLTGKKKDILLVVKLVERNDLTSYWLTKCECGIEKVLTYRQARDSKSCGCKRKSTFNDLSGLKVNRIKLIKCIGQNNWGCFIYDSVCDCGTVFVCEGNDIKSGKIKSCGCLISISAKARYNPDSLWKDLWVDYKNKAEDRNYEFLLTLEDIKKICKQNCYYCLSPPFNSKKRKEYIIIYNGIDRFQNHLGYNLENIRPCCKICNQAKHTLTPEKFKEWLERLAMCKINKTGFWSE